MSFLEQLNEDHFASHTDLPRGGEEWADLFQINTARKPPTMSCPTGCLPLFVPDVNHRHGLVPSSQSPSLFVVPQAPPAAAAIAKQPEQPKKKKSRQSTQVYQTSGPELDQPPITTRSGRLSKRPQNILILEDDVEEVVE
ncbi:hypothetical protein BASA81_007917 [Batrachochytrium salamandrivorans]|nr:hypothetical protein BASA81_007917 [Batrachochytrium salamandrivorans]